MAEGIEQGAKDAVDDLATSVAKNGVDDAAAGGVVAPEARFLATPSGVSVHASQAEMIKSITDAGAVRVGPSTATTEAGQIFHMRTA